MLTAGKHCVICASPLTVHEARGGLLCSRSICVWKYRTVPEAQRCAICGRPLEIRELARRTCSGQECSRKWNVDRAIAYREKRKQQLETEALTFRDETAARFQVGDSSGYRVTIVPYNHVHSSRLSDSRRAALREHVARVAAMAVEHREAVARGEEEPRPPLSPIDDPPPEVADVMMRACIGCRGFCCRFGGNHAYITPYTILHYLDSNPDHTVDQIVESYASKMSSHTIRNACVFQHSRGCVLPREMRSDTCNRFFCDALEEFRDDHRKGESPRAFFVPAHDGRIRSGILASPELVQVVRRKRESSTVSTDHAV